MIERNPTTEAGRIVSSALDAFNGGDTEKFLSHYSDDMKFWMNGNHGFSGLVEGKAAFVDLVGRVVEGLSEMITLDIVSFIEGGDWVIAESNGSAKLKSGAPYNNRYCMLWRVENGTIVEFKEYNDSAVTIASFF